METLTQEKLMKQLNYNYATGKFYRRSVRGRARAGEEVGTINNGYRYVYVDGKQHIASVLAWIYVYGERPFGKLARVNGDKLDDRIFNLMEDRDLASIIAHCYGKWRAEDQLAFNREVYEARVDLW